MSIYFRVRTTKKYKLTNNLVLIILSDYSNTKMVRPTSIVIKIIITNITVVSLITHIIQL